MACEEKNYMSIDTLEFEMTRPTRDVTLRWHFKIKCRCHLTFIFVFENVTWHFGFEFERQIKICQPYTLNIIMQLNNGMWSSKSILKYLRVGPIYSKFWGSCPWGQLVGTSPSVKVWSVHMHFNVKGFKIITLHSNFHTFLQHFTKKTWYWLFSIEYETNMMSHYIEEVHAIKWCTKIILISYIMHLIIIQLQRHSPSVFGQFPSVKNSSSIHIFHRNTA